MGSAGDFIRKIAQESARLAYNDFVRLTEGSAIGSWFVGLVSPDKTKITHPSGYVYNLQYTGQIRQYQLACIVTSSLAYAPGTGAIRTSMIEGGSDAYIVTSNINTNAFYVFKLGDLTPYKFIDIPAGYAVEPSSGTHTLIVDMTPDGRNLVTLDYGVTRNILFDIFGNPFTVSFDVTWTFTTYKSFSVGLDLSNNPIVKYSNSYSISGSQSGVGGSPPNLCSYVNNQGQVCIDMLITFSPGGASDPGGSLPGTISYYTGVCPETANGGSFTSADPNTVLGFTLYPHARGQNALGSELLFRSLHNNTATLYTVFGGIGPPNGLYYSSPTTAVSTYLGNIHPSSPIATDQGYFDLTLDPTGGGNNSRNGTLKAVDSLLFYNQQMLGVNSDTVNWDIQIATFSYDPISMVFTKKKSKKGKCVPLQQNDNNSVFNSSSHYLPVSFAIRGGVPHVN